MTTPEDEWRALGWGTRRVARRSARRLRAHPDPAVSAVAARYARAYLDTRTWHARAQWLALGLMMADVVVAAGVLGWLSGGPVADRPSVLEKTLIWLAAVVIAAAIVAPYGVRKARIIRLYRLELANKLTLENVAVPSGAPAPPPAAGLATAPGRGLSVRYDRRRFLRQWARMLAVVAGIAAVLTGQGLSSGMTPVFGALCVLFGVLALLIIVPLGTELVRWVLPGRPVVVLDGDGVHMPSIACDLPWAALAEVRLVPVRYARRGDQQAIVIAFVPRDPPAVLDAITGVGRARKRRLGRSLRVYGTPLSVSDSTLDYPGEQVAAAAAAIAAVPVRRL